MTLDLSQDQISKMFENGGEQEELEERENKPKYEPYDFNRPDKFNRDNVGSLKAMANHFGRLASQSISTYVRIPVSFQLNQKNPLEQIPYTSEYIEKMIRDYYAFVVVNMGSELGKMVIEFDLDLVFAIQKNQLGAGEILKFENDRREMDAIEKIMMSDWVSERILQNLSETFENIADLNMSLDKIETDPQYIKVTNPTDMVALITFDMLIGNEEDQNDREKIESAVRLVFPYMSIEPIVDKLRTENTSEFTVSGKKEDYENILKKHLKGVEKKVDIELGRSEMNIHELLNMNEGDTVECGNIEGKELIGYVNSKPKMKYKINENEETGKAVIELIDFSRKGDDRDDRRK